MRFIFLQHSLKISHSMNEQLRELGMVAYTCDPKCLGIETAWASWAQEDLVSTRKQFFCQIIITQGLWAGAVSPFQLASLLIHSRLPPLLIWIQRVIFSISKAGSTHSCHVFSEQRLESSCSSPWHRNVTGILVNHNQQSQGQSGHPIFQLLLLSLFMNIRPSSCYQSS